MNLSQDQIKDRIPHRFENLLLDSFQSEQAGEGQFSVNIAENDPLDRNIFTKWKFDDKRVLLPTVAMEIVALASISDAGSLPEGEIAIFAAISNFERSGDLNCEGPLTGSVKKRGDKGGFYRYSSTINAGDQNGSATGDVMAFHTSIDHVSTPSEDKKRIVLPKANQNIPIEKPSFKSPDMFALDSLVYRDPAGQDIICSYIYPKNHPLIKGHFPNQPMMMGVMQWMMVEDACFVLAKAFQKEGREGNYSMTCNADLVKPDGTIVCEIKQAVVDVFINVDGMQDQTEVLSTKRVIFRDSVSPGETLLIHLIPQ